MRKKKPRLFYGWIILLISFIIMPIAYGARNSFSVFYVAILDEFGWSRASTAGIFSINLLVYGTTAPFAGALVDRFGPKKVLLTGGTILALAIVLCSRINTIVHFYLLFGLVAAIGTSLVGWPANAAVLPHWFVRRRGIVFGIVASGFGLSFLIVSLVQYYIAKVGWRMSFILLGILIAVILLPLIALFSRHKPEDIGLFPDGTHPLEKVKVSVGCPKGPMIVDEEWASINWSPRKAMRTYRFWSLFFASFLLLGFAQHVVLVHQVALMRDVGFSMTFAASIVSLWGIMMALGTLGSFLSDKIGREKTFTIGCLASILGLFMLLLLEQSHDKWICYLYTVSFGLGTGLSAPVLAVASADIFQGKHFGSINGFLMLGMGLGGLIGPWFGGFVFDATENYSIALIVSILASCVALTLMWIAAPAKIRKVA